MIDYRKAPIPKLMRKLGVDIYDKPAPLKAGIVGGHKVRIASNATHRRTRNCYCKRR